MLRYLAGDIESGAVDVVAIHDAARPLAGRDMFVDGDLGGPRIRRRDTCVAHRETWPGLAPTGLESLSAGRRAGQSADTAGIPCARAAARLSQR